MESSQFSNSQSRFESIEQLDTQGATCDAFRVKLYGKLHFLKRLRPEYVGDIRYQEALRKEFETGYQLEHPNLVRYISLDADSILMEYVDGETLTQRLATHPDYFKNRKNADRFVRQLLDAISYLHSHQVLHLDLKPDNILLTRINDDVKLIDLGCCRTDTFVDTPGYTSRYAAPEQLSGGEVDARTDIYAIGKIIGQLPNHSRYNKVIARCTAQNPEERYQSVLDVRKALPSAMPKLMGLIMLAILVVVAVAVLLWYSSNQGSDEKSQPDANVPEMEVAPLEPAKDTVKTVPSAPIVRTPQKPSTPTHVEAPSAIDTIAQLRADIRSLVLPKFNQTIGALPDSVEVGGRAWYDACNAFEPMIPQLLQEVIVSHQSVPMETVAKEFNDYVQSLLTLKMNRVQTVQTNAPRK